MKKETESCFLVMTSQKPKEKTMAKHTGKSQRYFFVHENKSTPCISPASAMKVEQYAWIIEIGK